MLLTDNIGATKVELSDEDLATLDKVTALPAEYPGWMMQTQNRYRETLMQEQFR